MHNAVPTSADLHLVGTTNLLFYLYIYPPDSQESNGGGNT